MAAAVAPEYNSPALFVRASPLVFFSTTRHSVLLNSTVVFSAVSCAAPHPTRLDTLLCHVLLCPLSPCSLLLCSALVCFYSSALLCSTLFSSVERHPAPFHTLTPSLVFSSHLYSLFSTGSAPPQPLSALQTCSFIINLAVLLIRSVASGC